MTTKNNEDEIGSPKDRPAVSAFYMYHFSTRAEFILILLSLVCAVIAGAMIPVMVIFIGEVIDAMVINDMMTNPDYIQNICEHMVQCCPDGIKVDVNAKGCILPYPEDFFFMDEIKRFAFGLLTIAAISFVTNCLMVTCLNITAETQTFRIRRLFFLSIMRQDIEWHDMNQTSGLATRMTEDLNRIQDGIGEKLGIFIMNMATFFFCIISAFIHGWELTLVMFSIMPIMGISAGVILFSNSTLAKKEIEAYGKAGSAAEEAISSVRTVTAFAGREKEVERYNFRLVLARKASILKWMFTGAGVGLLWLFLFSSYGLVFWYGVNLVMDGREECMERYITEGYICNEDDTDYDSSKLLIVFFSILMGLQPLGQIGMYIEAFTQAKAAAANIFYIIERIPPIDSLSNKGKILNSQPGNIYFKNVYFSYPSRKDVKILQGLTMNIKKGQTVALVGPSGCGKSTVIQLIQRFYDIDTGSITLEEDDIRNLNIGKLRDRIGLVEQEPVLFGCSIIENIKYGRIDATLREIEQACKEANAYEFIMRLPKKFDTIVGEKGAMLSGGQKQRIAIARALIRNPSILLLDEATSALDIQSESIVQEALDKARAGRTTIVVAHRLSTIRNADCIVVIKDGKVSEQGTHDKLIAAKGLYFSLVNTQMAKKQLDDASYSYDTKSSTTVIDEKSVDTQLSGYKSTLSVLEETNIKPDQGSISGQKNYSQVNKRFFEDDLPEVETIRLCLECYPEWSFIIGGIFSSIITGGAMPVYSVLLSDVMGILSEQVDDARKDVIMYSFLFVGLGIIVGSAYFFQIYLLAYAGEHLTQRMRKEAFDAMLQQEIAFFDDPCNSTGALCARLSGDAAAIQGATGTRLGVMMHSVFCVLASFGIAMYFSWRLSLVVSCFVPLMLLGFYLQNKITSASEYQGSAVLAESSKIAVEAITNIRTVIGLRIEDTIVAKYIALLEAKHTTLRSQSIVRGFVFGFAQSVMFITYAVSMYYGGVLIENGLDYTSVFKVTTCLIISCIYVGQAHAFAPNYNKAMLGAARIFKLIDKVPLIDLTGFIGNDITEILGNVEYEHAEFSYPSRPLVKVLQGLSLEIHAGMSIALVGPSGCGKSTCIQLLLRFYNMDRGQLLFEGQNIETLKVPQVRSKLGLVSQEPILFDRTLAENIMYGDNERQVSMDEVVDSAKKANIHNFISQLPMGYDTIVGKRGSHLSGGQKQRVAIARALVRNPKIMLLDEATSALDVEAEKVVQEALNEAAEGRTSIMIAHRLSTIQNVDKIYVINHGKVIEQGTHEELMKHRGIYKKMWSQQSGIK